MGFSLSWPQGNFEMQNRIIQINEQISTSLDLDIVLNIIWNLKCGHWWKYIICMVVSDSHFVYWPLNDIENKAI